MNKTHIASHGLKALLVLFSAFVIFVATQIIPVLAAEITEIMPELKIYELPLVRTAQGMLVFLLMGIAVIIALLIAFDLGKTFTNFFTGGLFVLMMMCVMAVVVIIGVFYFLKTIGGPDPASGLFLMVTAFLISIIGMVILLVRSIVKQGMVYKEDYDLTV